MKEKIDKMIDDLINHEISKTTAKAMLLSLHNVSGIDFIFNDVGKIKPELPQLQTQLELKLVDGETLYNTNGVIPSKFEDEKPRIVTIKDDCS